MAHTATIAPWTGFDGQGEPTFGAAVTYRCRLGANIKNVRDARGQEVVSSHTLWLGASPIVNVLDKLVLSTGVMGSTEESRTSPPIISVQQHADQHGMHHTKLYLK